MKPAGIPQVIREQYAKADGSHADDRPENVSCCVRRHCNGRQLEGSSDHLRSCDAVHPFVLLLQGKNGIAD
jgi:hypothetical protein